MCEFACSADPQPVIDLAPYDCTACVFEPCCVDTQALDVVCAAAVQPGMDTTKETAWLGRQSLKNISTSFGSIFKRERKVKAQVSSSSFRWLCAAPYGSSHCGEHSCLYHMRR
jgi:hypothetical protein